MAQWQKIVILHRILSASRSHRPKQDLCRELECKPVTFDRLIRVLRNEFNAPIVNNKRYGGYKYDLKDGETFELPGLWFKTEELKALIYLEGIAQGLQNGFLRDAFKAFRNRLEKVIKNRGIEINDLHGRIRVVPIAYRKIDAEIFHKVSGAVLNRNCLKIEYLKPNKQAPQTREISPQRLIRYKDNWYVDAWCHNSEALREFAIDRITSAQVLPDECKEISNAELDEFFGSAYGIFTGPAHDIAEIKFTGSAALIVSKEEWHPKQYGEWINKDTYILKIPYGDNRELIMDVLRWGDNAEILNPLALRDAIAKVLCETQKKYTSTEEIIKKR